MKSMKSTITMDDLELAKEILRKNSHCDSKIISTNNIVLLYPIEQTQRVSSIIKSSKRIK